jgi:hypothetical protein
MRCPVARDVGDVVRVGDPVDVRGVAGIGAVGGIRRVGAGHQAPHGGGRVLGVDVQHVDGAGLDLGQPDVVAGEGLLFAREAIGVLQHALADLAHGEVELLVVGIEGDALHLPELHGAAHERGVAARLEAGGRLLHAGPEPETLVVGAIGHLVVAVADSGVAGRNGVVAGDRIRGGIDGIEDVGEGDLPAAGTAAVDQGPDLGVRRVAQVDPRDREAAAVGGGGLLHPGDVQGSGAQVPGGVGDELEETDHRAVVGEVDGPPIRHDVRQLEGHAAHAVVLLHGDVAGEGAAAQVRAVDLHLDDVAVVVRVQLGVVPAEVRGHRAVVVAAVRGLDAGHRVTHAGVRLVLLGAEVALPGRPHAGAVDPAAVHAREVDRLGVDRRQLAGVGVLVQLGDVEGGRAALELRHHEHLAEEIDQGGMVIVVRDRRGAVRLQDGVAPEVVDLAEDPVASLVAAAEDGVEADRVGLAVDLDGGRRQDRALLGIGRRRRDARELHRLDGRGRR